jgi:ABC-2 type transport system ATP-binding protein
MIEASGLTKRYGDTLAVDDLSFSVAPGKITGFLGPNGAGKTTTMRLILGLDRPTSGTVTINGKPFGRSAYPMREVGALLDAKAVHGGRSAYNHLLCLAETNSLPRRRVGEVLALVGLTEVARKRSKGFSLGMGQRLGIAAALLGDPGILMFDEPVNGLDPEGILWIRNLMKALAAEGRTVFVSSHLMSEMENTADHLLVIGRGSLIADCTVPDFIAANSRQSVRVRTPQPDVLARVVTAAGGTVHESGDGLMTVQNLDVATVGDLAFENSVRLHELAPAQASLEQAFMELTASSVQFHAGTPGGPDLVHAAGPGPQRAASPGPRHAASPGPQAGLPAARGRAGFAGTLRSEFTKIRSVRSTYWSLLALVVVTIGIGVLASWGAAHTYGQMNGPQRSSFLSGFDATQQSLVGLILGQLIISVLGALTVTSEYSTGMMRTSLSVMPRRGTLFAAKATVFAAVALAVGLVASFASFFIGQALMSGQHLNATLGQPGVLRAVIGGGLFLAACGLLAFGLGAILRHTAGAISAAIGLLFVLFILVNFLPSSWQQHVDKWIPFDAGSQIWTAHATSGGTPMFSAWTGFAVFCGYAAIALLAGLTLFRERDA